MNLRALREPTGLTQGALARKLGVGRTAVSMWESGDALPRADKLPVLAKVLGCTIDDLFKSNNEADEKCGMND